MYVPSYMVILGLSTFSCLWETVLRFLEVVGRCLIRFICRSSLVGRYMCAYPWCAAELVNRKRVPILGFCLGLIGW